MEKFFELILLVVLAFGSAILFSFAIIWKLFLAIFQMITTVFK